MPEDVQPALDRLWSAVVASIPSLVAAALALGAGILLGFALRALARRLVRRGLRRWSGAAPSDAAGAEGLVAGAAFWVPVALGAVAAADALGLPSLSAWLSGISSYLPRLIAAIVIVVLGVAAARVAATAAERMLRPLAGELSGNIAPVTRLLVLAVTAMIAAEQAGINLSVLTTFLMVVLGVVLGGAVLALALGARQSVENILALHHLRRTIRVRSRIRIDGVEGEVVRLTGVTVLLDVPDGIMEIPATRFAASAFAHLDPAPEGEDADVA